MMTEDEEDMVLTEDDEEDMEWTEDEEDEEDMVLTDGFRGVVDFGLRRGRLL